MMRENPWLGLPANVIVKGHPDDLPFLEAFNRQDPTDRERIRFDLPPHPWCGPIHSASVLVLAANPGWEEAHLTTSELVTPTMLRNFSGVEPNIWLDQSMNGSDGYRWHRQQLLKDVLAECSEPDIASKLALLEFHAYSSQSWRALGVTLPTQWYTFDVVRAAIERNALIVILRAEWFWLSAVPELIGYKSLVRVRSRNPRLSPKNLGATAWNQLFSRLAGNS
jgi:hypothetical protein